MFMVRNSYRMVISAYFGQSGTEKQRSGWPCSSYSRETLELYL